MRKQYEITYKVCYRSKVDCPEKRIKEGEEGVHANRLHSLSDANAAVEACKKWFNEDNFLHPGEVSESGEDEVTTTVHDRVDVWIDTYRDGYLHKSGDPNPEEKEEDECEPSAQEKTDESDTSSAASKSRKESSMAVA